MTEISRSFPDDEPSPARLSAAGERRRSQILAAAQFAASRRLRRRLGMRVTGACVAVLCGVVPLTARLAHRHTPTSPSRIVHADQRSASPRMMPRNVPPQRQPADIVVTRIQSDPQIARRLAVPPQPQSWRRLSDDDLLRQLADAGRPAGIAYLGGHATLLFHDRYGAAHRAHELRESSR